MPVEKILKIKQNIPSLFEKTSCIFHRPGRFKKGTIQD